MAAEIERKFVVHMDNLKEVPPNGVHMIQGYVALDANGAELRVRSFSNRAFLTIKAGKGLVRTEVEMEISAEEFAELWPLTEGRRIEKMRYWFPVGGGLGAEVDVYEGRLSGLIVAEVEFPSTEVAADFVPRRWFGKEVTDDARYKNQALAVHGRPA